MGWLRREPAFPSKAEIATTALVPADLRVEVPTARRANRFDLCASELIRFVQPLAQKYSAFVFSEFVISSPGSARQGAYASSRTWCGMRWTGWCREMSGTGADGEVVWSWRAHAGAKLSRSSKGFVPMTVANAGSPRRAPISRKPLRREGRLSPPVPVVHALAQFLFARGPRVQRPPGLPCALSI